MVIDTNLYGGFLKWWYPPNHPFIDGFSIVNHPFWGSPIDGNPYISTVKTVKVRSVSARAVAAVRRATQMESAPAVWSRLEKKGCGKPHLGEIRAEHSLVIRSSFIENSQALRHPASHRVFFCLTRTPWVAASGWIVETVGNPRLLDVTQGWGLMSRICSHHFLLYLL